MDYLSLTLSVSTALTVASLFVTKGSAERPAIAYRIVAALYVMATLVFATIHSTTMGAMPRVIAALVTVVSGVVAYQLFRNPSTPTGSQS